MGDHDREVQTREGATPEPSAPEIEPAGPPVAQRMQAAELAGPPRGSGVRLAPAAEPGQRFTLRGGTHRFVALMHIYESGDFGSGGLSPSTVISEDGMTLEAVYLLYREGRIGSENARFEIRQAGDLVESIRQRGFVTDAESSAAEGLDGHGTDGLHLLYLLPAGDVTSDQDIDTRLDQERGVRHFVQNGYTPETREQRRERAHREHFLEDFEAGEGGDWRRVRNGDEVTDADRARLRESLPENAAGRGVLAGPALQRYRDFVADESNPILTPEQWARQHHDATPGASSVRVLPPPTVVGDPDVRVLPPPTVVDDPDVRVLPPPTVVDDPAVRVLPPPTVVEDPAVRVLPPPIVVGDEEEAEPEPDDAPERPARMVSLSQAELESESPNQLTVRTQRDGRAQSVTGQINTDGAEGSVSREGEDGVTRGASGSVRVGMGSEGVQSVDASVGVSRSRDGRSVRGSFTFGGTYYADRPRQSRDGKWRVSWQVALRGGLGVGGSAEHGQTGASGSIGFNQSGERQRAGVDVFDSQAAAEAFQDSFESMSAEAVSRLCDAATQEMEGLAWWQNQPAGTQRSCRISGTRGGEVAAGILGVSLGVGRSVTVRDTVQVTKVSDTVFEVVQRHDDETRTPLSVSSPLLGASGGMGLYNDGYVDHVTNTFRVDTSDAAARGALERLLSGASPIGPGPGVARSSQTTERGPIENNEVNLALMRAGGRRGTTTVRTTREGQDDQVTHRAIDEASGSNLAGGYFRRNLQFDAPGQGNDGDYQATTDYHTTEDPESSGNWQVVRQWTPAQMRLAQLRFMENWVASPFRDVARMTASERAFQQFLELGEPDLSQPDPPGHAETRARIFAELVGAGGERQLDVIDRLAGGASSTSVRLFTGGSEDLTFLTMQERRELTQQITQWQQAVRAARESGEAVDPGTLEAINARVADLQPRVDAIRDPSRYPDLPVDRDELVATYQAYVDQLNDLLASSRDRGEGTFTEGLTGPGMDHYYAMMAARGRMQRAAEVTERERTTAMGLRDDRWAASTDPRWDHGDEQKRQGDMWQRFGEEALDRSREQDVLSRERALRDALTHFGDAERHFEEATQVYRQLGVFYRQHQEQVESHLADGEGEVEAAPAEPTDVSLRAIADALGVPEVDLRRAVRRNREAFARWRSLRRLLPYDHEVPRGIAMLPEWRQRIADAVAVALYQRRTEGLRATGILDDATVDALAGETQESDPQAAAELGEIQQARGAVRGRRAARQQAAADANYEAGLREETYDWGEVIQRVQSPTDFEREPFYLGRGMMVQIVGVNTGMVALHHQTFEELDALPEGAGVMPEHAHAWSVVLRLPNEQVDLGVDAGGTVATQNTVRFGDGSWNFRIAFPVRPGGRFSMIMAPR